MIVGAGFAGYYCARWLDRQFASSADVVLVNPGDHMVYAALLPDVVGGVVDPGCVATPLAASLRSTTVLVGNVTAVDFDGVLHEKSPQFSDEVTGDAVPGAAEGLARLAARYNVVIFIARTALDPVRRWMADHGMGGFEVTHEKPAAGVYIDDHAFRFTSWGDVELALLETSVDPPVR